MAKPFKKPAAPAASSDEDVLAKARATVAAAGKAEEDEVEVEVAADEGEVEVEGVAKKGGSSAPRKRKWNYGIQSEGIIRRVAGVDESPRGVAEQWPLTAKPTTVAAFLEAGGDRHGLRVLSRAGAITITVGSDIFPQPYDHEAKAAEREAKAAARAAREAAEAEEDDEVEVEAPKPAPKAKAKVAALKK